MENNYKISVFGHILENFDYIQLREDQYIEYTGNNIREIRSFIHTYWYDKKDMRGINDIFYKIDLVLGIEKRTKIRLPITNIKRQNIGEQTSLDLFDDL